jgi:hypothetical protein
MPVEMTEAYTVLLHGELERVGIAIEADAEDFLSGSRRFPLAPQTMFSRLVYTFSSTDAFLDGLGGGIDEAKRVTRLCDYDGWEQAIWAV